MISPSLLRRAGLTGALALASFGVSAAATYDVGPGYLPRLASVPWGKLLPGDTVNIHTKPGGYHEIIQLSEAGTAAKPITIRGIPDPVTGALPVIDGAGAVTDPQVDFRSPVFENMGVVLVTPRAKGYVYGKTYPAWITIESLDIRNALYSPQNPLTFLDSHGATRTYDHFACGIYIEFAQHLTIRGCEVSFNGNGIFANSKNGANQSSADLLIEKNYLHDNGQPTIAGVTNGYAEHNIYIESDGAVYQYNKFGPLRAGCHGTMIKDRSAGTIIRYNEVISTECSDIFAILDPQGGAGYLNLKPSYPDAYVYGNTITLQPGSTVGTNVVWFGAFNGPAYYPTQHRGTLYFYQNTVVNRKASSAAFSLTDLPYTPTPNIAEKVDCRNNIFYTDSAITANPYNTFKMVITGAVGVVNLGNNWLSPGTTKLWYQHEGGGIVNGWASQLVGDSVGKNNPGFVNLVGGDYHLAGGSNSINAGGVLAPGAYPVSEQYVAPQNHIARTVIGSAPDLGAFESSANPPVANHAPVALPQSVNLLVGASVPLVLKGTDADGDTLYFTTLGPPTWGTLSGTSPNLTYKLTSAVGGSEIIGFVASDGKAVSAPGYLYIGFNTPGVVAPVVSLNSPVNNTVLTAPGSLTLTASASAVSGIKKVDFFVGNTLLYSATTAPYTFTWSGISAGTYNVVAKAFDTLGQRTFSTPVVVTVN